MLGHCNLLSVQGVAQYFAWRKFLNQFISFHLGKTGRIDHFSKLQIVKPPFWPTDMLFACTQKILLEKKIWGKCWQNPPKWHVHPVQSEPSQGGGGYFRAKNNAFQSKYHNFFVCGAFPLKKKLWKVEISYYKFDLSDVIAAGPGPRRRAVKLEDTPSFVTANLPTLTDHGIVVGNRDTEIDGPRLFTNWNFTLSSFLKGDRAGSWRFDTKIGFSPGYVILGPPRTYNFRPA